MTDLDLTQPICTRDGRRVRIVSTDSRHTEGPYRFPILAEVEYPRNSGHWVQRHYMPDGRGPMVKHSVYDDLTEVSVYEHRMAEEERRMERVRSIRAAQIAVAEAGGITDRKTVMALCAAFNCASENMDADCTKYRLSDDELGDILEGCQIGARRLTTWLRKERNGHHWVCTLKGATLFNLMEAATTAAWNGKPPQT
ncbi:hypothetical protein TSA6c_00045 [Azospirillum sp. TSA6c]|uniref:hypothetical protein n=1 Tax=Azospirillum sp. TSA6c TaxID=709813 RepID=UPI000D621850|nr:hypothetical protein [Azospirillum sp. TSA6c]PWC54672.1 hypothetical protein TSA6c_00045 [Azospirillum sp. TSA6c]